VAVLPAGHPLAGRKSVSLKELAAEPFILLDEGEHSVPLEAFSAAGLRPRIEYRVFDDYSILAMVRQGLGVSLLYRLVLTGYDDRLAVRPLTNPLTRTIGLALRSWETLPYGARQFAEFTKKNAALVLAGVSM
jgi:DNA-binding transcriptional LysR family regulator